MGDDRSLKCWAFDGQKKYEFAGTSRLMLEISLKFMVISVFPPVHSVRQILMYLWVTVIQGR